MTLCTTSNSSIIESPNQPISMSMLFEIHRMPQSNLMFSPLCVHMIIVVSMQYHMTPYCNYIILCTLSMNCSL